MMKKAMAIILAGTLVVAGGLGFTMWKNASAEETDDSTLSPLEQHVAKATSTPDTKTDGAPISMQKAVEIAEAQQGGVAVEVELDRDDGRIEYEIDIITADAKYDIHVDAKTGEIIKAKKEDDDREDRAKAEEANISISEAINIVDKEVNGKTVEIELDREDGRVIYEAEAKGKDGKKYEVDLDAKTGQVIKVEVDDDDDDEDEDD